ncbi:anti-sigma factor domain-containing protein [Streptomyces sp. TS71-3]|uniref:anti-sigma factor n=1 Tax=Streptomyces sp. TS71-3 TaxID=2733862 RepID=UPI001B1036FC|nr:anti-sigma factor [Streptomyces sp. TS71-3]GHJ37144.1 hypothetical protein Sm713_27530 [Streptomyces sp. TS71-3]
MSDADLHALSGAYALDALSREESEEFARHLRRCEACAQEVRELRETAARLALAVAEVPPAGLRSRVMAALPEVRQHPPGAREAAVVPLRRRWRRGLPYLAAAACLVFAVVTGALAVDAHREVERQRSRTARAQQQAEALSTLMAAPDASFRPAGLKGGGTATLVSSRRLGQAAFVYRGLPALPDGRVYELWFSRGGTMHPAGLLAHGRASGSTLLAGALDGADGVGVTAEPGGGSPRPTGPPLALIPV